LQIQFEGGQQRGDETDNEGIEHAEREALIEKVDQLMLLQVVGADGEFLVHGSAGRNSLLSLPWVDFIVIHSSAAVAQKWGAEKSPVLRTVAASAL